MSALSKTAPFQIAAAVALVSTSPSLEARLNVRLGLWEGLVFFDVMPAQNRLRLDNPEGIQNTRRDPIQADENQTIEGAQDRPLRRTSVEYIQLMTQSQVLCPKRCSRSKQPDEHPPDQIEQVPHASF